MQNIGFFEKTILKFMFRDKCESLLELARFNHCDNRSFYCLVLVAGWVYLLRYFVGKVDDYGMLLLRSRLFKLRVKLVQ